MPPKKASVRRGRLKKKTNEEPTLEALQAQISGLVDTTTGLSQALNQAVSSIEQLTTLQLKAINPQQQQENGVANVAPQNPLPQLPECLRDLSVTAGVRTADCCHVAWGLASDKQPFKCKQSPCMLATSENQLRRMDANTEGLAFCRRVALSVKRDGAECVAVYIVPSPEGSMWHICKRCHNPQDFTSLKAFVTGDSSEVVVGAEARKRGAPVAASSREKGRAGAKPFALDEDGDCYADKHFHVRFKGARKKDQKKERRETSKKRRHRRSTSSKKSRGQEVLRQVARSLSRRTTTKEEKQDEKAHARAKRFQKKQKKVHLEESKTERRIAKMQKKVS
jgi:hypothetical protein